jgi:4-amino-4-deoxy-L-arabinose transferase-like glycosyltransferase
MTSRLHTFLTRRREDPAVTGSETVAADAPYAHGISRVALVVGGLVVASTLIRFGVAQAFTTPWIAPDEMVYGMLGEGLWTHGSLTLRELDAPYYSLLTPALVGAPLRLLDLADGIQWARLLQSFAMSLVAVPTYLWARRLATPGWALAAATIALAAPAFHYAGFLMTEPLTLLVVTVALLALARALEEPSTWRYGVFVAWTTAAAAVRLQALVLLPAFVLAALLDAVAARDRGRLRPLARLGLASAAVVVVVAVVAVATGGELSRRSIFGAYTPVGESAPASGEGLGEILWHAFDVGVLGLGLPVLAFAALAARVFSRRDPHPPLRAFVSTSLGYAALLVVQVGLFSSVYVGAVAERYLVTLVPLLAIALCAWISRGAPRERRVVVPAWIALIALAALVPLDQLLTPGAIVNTFTPAPLGELGSEALQRLALLAAATAAGALVVFLPPRRAWVCAAVVGVGLALVSAETARLIRHASAHEDRAAMGSAPPGWLDDAGIDDATLLVNGDRIWTSVARMVFWNRAIRDVVRIAPAEVPFPPDTPAVSVGEDGVLRTEDGSSLDRSVVVAPDTLTLAGEPLLGRPQGDSEVPGLTAWRAEAPARVVLSRAGFLPNGDFVHKAQITVYQCRPGTLDVTILGKSGKPVRAFVDGIHVATLETPAGESAVHRIPTPPYANGTHACGVELQTAGYAGSTTIVFTPQ